MNFCFLEKGLNVCCRENLYFNSSSFCNSSAELVAEARGLRGEKMITFTLVSHLFLKPSL